MNFFINNFLYIYFSLILLIFFTLFINIFLPNVLYSLIFFTLFVLYLLIFFYLMYYICIIFFTLIVLYFGSCFLSHLRRFAPPVDHVTFFFKKKYIQKQL